MILELSSVCDQRCPYCYWSDPKKLPFKPGIMNRNLALYLIDQGGRMGINSIKPNGRGEGTLHPDYLMLCEYIYKTHKKTGAYIDRITNSNFRFPRNRENILKALTFMSKVKVSLDSFDKDVFEKQRKNNTLENILKNVDDFYNYPGRNNQLVIQAVRTELNKDEDLEHEIKSRWPEAIASVRDVVSGRNDSTRSLSSRDLSNRTPCKQAFVRLIVQSDGTVAPCCPSFKNELIIGDANRNTLRDIFNSKQAKRLRQQLKSKTAFTRNPCKSCPSYESYKGFKGKWDS